MKKLPRHTEKLLRFVLRLGFLKSVLLLTLIAVVASITITYLVTIFDSSGPGRGGLLIAILVPVLVSPPLSYLFLRLLYELDQAHQLASKLAVTDELTGISNRRHFFELAELEYQRSRRYTIPLSVIIFDIDDFKTINDRFGHLTGDQVLREVSALCQGLMRSHDVFARYGGEEFVILLPQTALEETGSLADRLRCQVAALVCCSNPDPVQVTISLGVAELDASSERLDNLLHRADMALYEAKARGKDRVVTA